MAIKTHKWDTADFLTTEEDRLLYLEACLNENDIELIAHAVGVIARSRGMSGIARETGLNRESLYRTFAKGGNPKLTTFLRVLNALGYKLDITPRERI